MYVCVCVCIVMSHIGLSPTQCSIQLLLFDVIMPPSMACLFLYIELPYCLPCFIDS